VEVKDGQITFTRPTDQIRHRALHGLYRALISNLVKRSNGWLSKKTGIDRGGFQSSEPGQCDRSFFRLFS
jgi:large subunit ribosomal protein L6